ncbi:MAG TPA: hypothetical protein VM554_00525 [Acidisarcina sp.]|nr:hypothetical protein [Acidisarcina sp.]
MRRSATSFALASLLVLGASTSAVLAQSNAPASQEAAPPPMAGTHHQMQPPDPAKQLAHMTQKLNLSADQQTQIKPILESRNQQMEALHADSTLTRQDRMAKMKRIQEDTHSKIEAVLNDEQKKKFAEMRDHQHEMMEKRMKQHHEGGMAPGTPPPAPPAQ